MAENKNKKDKKPETDVTILEKLFDGENHENIFLFDEDGNEIELEQVAAVSYKDEIYAVLHAVGEPEEEVMIFRVDTEDEESLIMIDDENLANEVLKIVIDGANERNE